MNDDAAGARPAFSSGLGQLPEPAYPDCYAVPRTGGATRDGYSYEQMRAYAAQEAAAERERCGQAYGSREVAMTAELGRLRAELADALHAMRAYARENPRHEYQGSTQDPNGVHAWLARNDRA